MLLVTADVENVLVEFHHTPIASEGEMLWAVIARVAF